MDRKTKSEAKRICNDILKLHKQLKEIENKIKQQKDGANEKKKI